ncbi:hypothetical protein [Streptomyces orinoci]|uniref:Transmembrane protein n=1 Tax=Streptomyces orinoci TaxID=67339 RepID=A0ABV3K3P5_STRON|nr:hypothetical protein [Streptomyces orinoci]
MHMNSAPHLLAEDRPEFERVLDQALRSADRDPEISALIAAVGQRLNTEQLRTMALGAMAAISACAMAEYRTYVRVREKQRAHSTAAAPQPVAAGGSARGEGGEHTSATDTAATGSEGAGAGAVLAVLAPVLAGIAALLFLVIGYALRLTAAHDSVGGPMVTVGWWFAGLTAAGALVAMAALLITALRNGRGAGAEGGGHRRPTEVDLARDAWREALLERGILPFLREALANPPSSTRTSALPRPRDRNGRTPHLGYSRPGFTSPDFGGGSSEERQE